MGYSADVPFVFPQQPPKGGKKGKKGKKKKEVVEVIEEVAVVEEKPDSDDVRKKSSQLLQPSCAAY